ncbi:MAG: TRAP transporter large permease [Chloroflexota bacterium]
MITPNWIWGLIEIGILSFLAMIGVHIFIVLGIIGTVFAFLYYGDMRAITIIGGSAFARGSEYAISMVPLFLLMGAWVQQAGLGKDAYDACVRWFSRIKGSLAIVSIIANALFGTVTGSAFAAIATIGGISLPEMRRYGYSATLRTGSIASGSMLSNLIPPSTIAIFYALLTEESVGRLFIGGIIPGIILTIFFCIVIYIWVSLKPDAAPMLPSTVRFTLWEKIRGSATIAPIIVIFLVIIGGIYLGWFSPTEAAGIGAFTVLVVALAYRRLPWKKFDAGLLGAVRTSGMILILLVGAFLFAHTLSLTKISTAMGRIVTDAGLSYIPLTYIVVLIFIIVGLPLEGFTLLIFTVPILYPLMKETPGAPEMAGIWFGTLVVLLVMLAAATPPIAGMLYLTQLIDGCPTKDVIIGVTPSIRRRLFYWC